MLLNYENLSERKKEILYNAIENYIQNASPITSAVVHDKYLQDISPATLRNELNALEAMGYLKQLHTSSGRVPTTKAYRLFVNELMHQTKFNKRQLTQVKEIIGKRTALLSDIVNSLADVISEATNYPTVVVMKGYEKLIIESIKIIPLIDGSGIVLIGTKNGIINNTINLTKGTTEENCIDASNYLSRNFKGKSLKDLKENLYKYVKDINSDIEHFEGLFNDLIDCLTKLTTSSGEFASTGATKLRNNPEYSQVEEAKKILSILEDDETLKEAIKDDEDIEISFSIGSENKNEALENCSVVKAHYNIDGENVASIGIIGPERMDYGKVASALKFIVTELKNLDKLENTKKENEWWKTKIRKMKK